MGAVLDTSALARLFLEDEGHQVFRDWVQAALEEEIALFAPDLALYELGRVIERECGDLDVPTRGDLLHLVTDAVRFTRPSTIAVFDQAHANGLTFYDASFLALAADLGEELITFDLAQRTAATAEGVPVRRF